jgi:hypothetical protein
MVGVKEHSENLSVAAKTCLEMLCQQHQKTGKLKCMTYYFKDARKKTKESTDGLTHISKGSNIILCIDFHSHFISKGDIRKLAVMIWASSVDIAPNAFEHRTWDAVSQQLNVQLDGHAKMTDLLEPMAYVTCSIFSQRAVEAGFVHLQYDFGDINDSSILVIIASSCSPTFQKFCSVLGTVDYKVSVF